MYMCIPALGWWQSGSQLRGQTVLLRRSAGAPVTPSGSRSEAAAHLRPPSVAACLSRGGQMNQHQRNNVPERQRVFSRIWSLLLSPMGPKSHASQAQLLRYRTCMWYKNEILDWQYGGVLAFPSGYFRYCSSCSNAFQTADKTTVNLNWI